MDDGSETAGGTGESGRCWDAREHGVIMKRLRKLWTQQEQAEGPDWRHRAGCFIPS